MRKVKYAIIGFGGIAENRIAKEGFGIDTVRFHGHPEAELVGVTDAEANRERAATALGLKWYESTEAVLDDPEVLYLAAPLPPQKKVDQVMKEIDAWIAEKTAAVPSDDDRSTARQVFGFMLGTFPMFDAVLANNPYGRAFGLAVRDRTGMDRLKLADAMMAVDEKAWRAMVEAVFKEGRSATVAASPGKKRSAKSFTAMGKANSTITTR